MLWSRLDLNPTATLRVRLKMSKAVDLSSVFVSLLACHKICNFVSA